MICVTPKTAQPRAQTRVPCGCVIRRGDRVADSIEASSSGRPKNHVDARVGVDNVTHLAGLEGVGRFL